MKQKLLILTEYFYPAVNGGGPVSSISNLSSLLSNDFEIKIICQNKDFNSDSELDDIISNTWINWNNKAEIFYCSKSSFNSKTISNIVVKEKIDILYINAIYQTPFIFKTVKFAQKIGAKVIIAPRGMLQRSALDQKALKKSLYFNFLKLSGILKDVVWHSTNLKENQEIEDLFPNSQIKLVENIPCEIEDSAKQIEENILKLCSISLNTKMKNINFILEVLGEVKKEVTLDIYGPIRDTEYWDLCLNSIQLLPKNIKVNYKGSVHPDKISETINKYHLYISPTLGENFGHSIFEAFANGVPVLISKNTPWKNLQEKEIGYDLKLDKDLWINTIEKLNLDDLNRLRPKALNFAKEYVSSNNYKRAYIDLFNK